MTSLVAEKPPQEKKSLKPNGESRFAVTHDWDAKETYFQYGTRMSKEIWAFRFAISKLITNNLRSRYRGSLLGFFWSLLNPLMSMLVITCIFALIWKCEIRQFAPHIFSALLPWAFISTSLEKGAASLVASENLLKTIYAPKVMFPLVHIGTEACNFLFCVVAFFIIGLFLGFQPALAIVMLPLAVALTGMFCLGLSMALSVATVYFRDLSHILNIFLSLMFYALPILYPVTKIPETYRWIIYYNPVYSFISLYQSILRDGTFPAAGQLIVAFSLASISLAVGLFILKNKENNLVFRL